MKCGRLSSLALFLAFLLAGYGSAWALTINILQQNAAPIPFQVQAVTPYDEQEVGALTQYSLRFSVPVKPDRSDIKILSSYGHVIATSPLASPDGISLHTTFEPLPPGRYTVKWRTECRCGGDVQLQDTFHFTVRP